MLVVPLGLLTQGEAKAMSAAELFTMCTNKTTSGTCGVYMAGFITGMIFGSKKVCLPKGITGNQLKTIFESFMRNYPKLQTEDVDSGFTIGLALLEAYPCPGTMPQTRVP